MPWVYITQGIFISHVTDFVARGAPGQVTDCAWVRLMRMQKMQYS